MTRAARSPDTTDVVATTEAGGTTYAYRRIGMPTQTPLVLIQRFRGTIDDWDPLLEVALASRREVVTFDNEGVGSSSGTVAPTIEGMARQAAAFIGTLDREQVDVLGWSMGGAVAQRLALDHPHLVRRLVLAATGPGGVHGAPATPGRVWEVAGKTVNDDEDFLYLFFTDDDIGLTAGRRHLARVAARRRADAPPVSPLGVRSQSGAIFRWATGEGSALAHLGDIGHPVLVANGQHDRMVHAYHSYVLAQGLPDAELVLYPHAGHGFLFQHTARFARAVTDFLDT
jgi:pimeloyl-ACP methyl ester carboxylesterase